MSKVFYIPGGAGLLPSNSRSVGNQCSVGGNQPHRQPFGKKTKVSKSSQVKSAKLQHD